MICLRYIKQNAKILANFLVYKFCENAVSAEFWAICESPETLRKLWNLGILRSDWLSMMILYWLFFSVLRKYFVKLLVDVSSSIFPHSDWIRTRKTPNTDTFHAVIGFCISRTTKLGQVLKLTFIYYIIHTWLWKLIFWLADIFRTSIRHFWSLPCYTLVYHFVQGYPKGLIIQMKSVVD